MAKGYTTQEAIENYMLQDIDSSFEDQLDDWISGIEKVIDQMTGRNFVADSAATARLFDGDGDEDLLIDECVEVTKVEVGLDGYGGDFTEISESGSDRYFLHPVNYTAKGLPVRKVSLSARFWPEGKQNNRITAKWGYSAAVPDDIKFAATIFVAGILNQQRGGGDKVKSEKIGNYAVTYSDNGGDSFADFQKAMDIIDAYRRIRI